MAKDPITVVHEEESGRILTANSMTFFDDRVTTKDVIICGSYCAYSSIRWVLRVGAKAAVAHECGVGMDGAGIAGLVSAQERGIPMVACETMSARLADGDSVYETGKVGHANEAATDLGVRPGQPIQEAARLLLKAPPGKVIEPEGISEKNTITVLDETENGTVYAS